MQLQKQNVNGVVLIINDVSTQTLTANHINTQLQIFG